MANKKNSFTVIEGQEQKKKMSGNHKGIGTEKKLKAPDAEDRHDTLTKLVTSKVGDAS